MMETNNSDSPAPKKEDEEIVDLINEMTQDLESEPELILLSAEVPPSGDKEDEVLELSEDLLMDDSAIYPMAPSENPTEAVYDTADDGILELNVEELNVEELNTEEMEMEPVDLFEEIPSSEDASGDILELSDDAPLMEESERDAFTFSKEPAGGMEKDDDVINLEDVELLVEETEDDVLTFSGGSADAAQEGDSVLDLEHVKSLMEESEDDVFTFSADPAEVMEIGDDVLSLSDEPTVVADESDDVLNLGNVESLMDEAESDVLSLSDEPTVVADEPLHGSAAVFGQDSGLGVANDAFFDINELPTLQPDDPFETDGVPGSGIPKPIQHAKDLVQDGFELGEALDLAIDKQLVVNNDLVAALGLGLGLDEPSEEARSGHSGSGVPSVSSEQLEAAIERVIDRMLGSKIDRLLATAVENAVTREIKRLKRLLSEILPDN